MMKIREIVQKYKFAEKDRTFPFAEWHRKDIFDKLVKYFLTTTGYNPDQISYDDAKGTVELEIRKDLKAIVYLSSIQEEQRFLSNKTSAPIDTIPDPETGKPEYEIAVVTNFEKWFFYFDGKEIYAIAAEKLEREYDTLRWLISKDAIESGKFREVARKLLHKEDNEPLRQELNILRIKIANKILQEKINIENLKNPDSSYNNELLNEMTTRWITRFLSLKLAEDSGISFNFTLGDIRRSFELSGKAAKSVRGAKVKEETLSNAVRVLMNEFERRYNGGIFMYEEGVDYLTVPDTAFFDLLDFATGWAFTAEDPRIIGFVYERFLGQEIVVGERKGKLEAVLKNIGEARGRKKTGGIYYTPKYIVDYIGENTIGEILNEKREVIDSGVKNLDVDKFINVLKQVKSLSVLDPACGSGSFLIRVLAELKNFYDEVKNKAKGIKRKIDALKRERIKELMLFTDDKKILQLENKYSELKKEIDEIKFSGAFALRHNIYGVDLDPKAIDITAFTLMIQVYDELKDGARCPTMIGENLKIGNSLVSAVTPEKKDGFVSRRELERFKHETGNLIKLRETEKGIDVLDEESLRQLVKENFDDVVEIYLHIKESYPNAIPTPQQNLLDEWNRKAKKEPIEKTFDILIYQTGLARVFLKEVYFERIREIKERIEKEIDKPLIRYFNSEKRILKNRELEEILSEEETIVEELKFVKRRATEISKNQPPKVFNWELEFPEVFFNGEGTLKQNPGFEAVVGNPPWGRTKQFPEKVEKELLAAYWNNVHIFQQGNLNLYKLFLEQCYLRLANRGFFSMIFPSTFLGEVDSLKLRKLFFEQNTIKRILHFPTETTVELFQKVVTMRTTIVVYTKEFLNNYSFLLKTEITCDEARNLSSVDMLKIEKKELKALTDKTYQIPIFKDLSNEWKILEKLRKYPRFSSAVRKIGDGHLHETIDRMFMSSNPHDNILIRRMRLHRYFIDLDQTDKWRQPMFVKANRFLRYKPQAKEVINSVPLLLTRELLQVSESKRLQFSILEDPSVLGNSVRYVTPAENMDTKYLCTLLNSTLMEWRFRIFSQTYHIKPYEIEPLPIVHTSKDRQASLISLVDVVIQKKKKYHSVSQNIEDHIDFKNVELIRLDEFLKKKTGSFDVLSSLRVKQDNFDVLRVSIEGEYAMLQYGMKRKAEEYEIEEGKKSGYIIEWHEAGQGKITDEVPVEFLTKILAKEKRISKAKMKTIWQKIAEVKIPEFTNEVKNGFLKFIEAQGKVKKLDDEITKIDRAIDRLVYELYRLM